MKLRETKRLTLQIYQLWDFRALEEIKVVLSKINLAFKKNETFIPKETKHTNDDEEEKDDNIDAAKIWAKQQKQSLAK